MRWWRDPLRGLGWRARRRIWKLSRSGKLIEHPEDRFWVEAFVRYQQRYLGSRMSKVLRVVWWLAGSTFLAGAAVRFVQGRISHAIYDLVIASLGGFNVFLTAWLARAYERTAQVNLWN